MKEDAPRVIKIPAKPEATRQAEARRQLRVAAYQCMRPRSVSSGIRFLTSAAVI